MRASPARISALPFILATVLACGGDDQGGLGPTTGSLRITTQSRGYGADPDGYVLLLDGKPHGPIGDSSAVVLNDLAAGAHTVSLTGIISFCTPDDSSRAITVAANSSVEVAFLVSCRGLGSLDLSVSSSGGTPDPDGYMITVDGAAGRSIASTGTLSVTGVSAGTHGVSLSGLAFNCRAEDPNQSATVSPASATEVRFTVGCSTLAPWRVLFQGFRPGPDHSQWDLFGVDPQTGQVSRLTENVYNDEFPVLSPDRTRVAFLLEDGNEDSRLAVMNVDGTEVRTLTPEPVGASEYAWSPDGSRIAYTRQAALFVINPDGTGERYLGPYSGPVSWSPDGTRIAAIGWPGPHIWVVPVDGGSAVNLTPGDSAEVEAVWSPDGRRLAFTRRTMRDLYYGSYSDDVWVMNADGSKQGRLSKSPGALDYAGAERLRWSPDGKLILFNKYRDGTYESDLFTIQPDGTALTNLTNTADVAEEYADWSFDGDKIVFAGLTQIDDVGSAEVFVMNSDGSGRENLSNHQGMDFP